MFATVEEAEKAAAMLRRFGGVALTEVYAHPILECPAIVIVGSTTLLTSWDEVADFLTKGYRAPQEDRRAEKRANAHACVAAVRRQLGWGRDANDRELITGLVAALEYLLEALA